MASIPPKPSALSETELDRPKTLGRIALPSEPPDLVPARMINEVLYCERLMYLEWAQGEFEDNAFTAEGREIVHARVDKPRKRRRTSKQQVAEATQADEPPPYQARSVWLSSERLGITAKIDIIEEGEGGAVVPVEYKRGHVPDQPHQAYPPERAQVCAQILLLRDNGYTCHEGSLFFAADRRRVPVLPDPDLVETTLRAASRARDLARDGITPEPLRDSPKCNGCSLVGICLPDEVTALMDAGPSAAYTSDAELHGPLDEDPWGLVSPRLNNTLRKLQVARDDRLPVYVQTQGAYVALDGERLSVRGKDAGLEARLPNTSQVCLFGNVQISTAAVRALLQRAIPLFYFSYGGWFLGRTIANDSGNIELRVAQHARMREKQGTLELARGCVVSKILNCRTLLRRNAEPADPVPLFELKQLARKASQAASIESLLGFEGSAARVYFQAFPRMLRAQVGGFDLEGRNRRPPRDPVNALLSFAYAMLTKDLVLAVTAAGLDPLLGFYHQPRFGRPALALDLMEEFRPLIADSTVLNCINTGVVGPRDFLKTAGACALTIDGRKRFLQAYERRMDELVTHPIFGYRMSYRRILEVQARLLGRHFLGEIPSLPAFRTR